MLVLDTRWSVLDWILNGVMTTVFSGAGFLIMTLGFEYAKLYHRKRIAKERLLRELLVNQLNWTSGHELLDNQLPRRARLCNRPSLFDIYKRSSAFLGNTDSVPTGSHDFQDFPTPSVESLLVDLFGDQEDQPERRNEATTSGRDSLVPDKAPNDPKGDVFRHKAVSERRFRWVAESNVTLLNPSSARHQVQRYQNRAICSDAIRLWSSSSTSIKRGKKSKEGDDVANCPQGRHTRSIQCSSLRTLVSPRILIQVTNKPYIGPQARKVYLGADSISKFQPPTRYPLESGSSGENVKRDNFPVSKTAISYVKPQGRKKRRAGEAIPITKNSKHTALVNQTNASTASTPAGKAESTEKVVRSKSQRSGRYGMTESLLYFDHTVDEQDNNLTLTYRDKESDKQEEIVSNRKELTKSRSTLGSASVKSFTRSVEASQSKQSNSLSPKIETKHVGLLRTNIDNKNILHTRGRKKSKQRVQNERSPISETWRIQEKSSLKVAEIIHDFKEKDKSSLHDAEKECDELNSIMHSNQTNDVRDLSIQRLYNQERSFDSEIAKKPKVKDNVPNNLFSPIYRAGPNSRITMQNFMVTRAEKKQVVPSDIGISSEAPFHFDSSFSVKEKVNDELKSQGTKSSSYDLTSKEMVVAKTNNRYRSTRSKHTNISLVQDEKTLTIETMEDRTNIHEKYDYREGIGQKLATLRKNVKVKQNKASPQKIKEHCKITVTDKNKTGEENSVKLLKSALLDISIKDRKKKQSSKYVLSKSSEKIRSGASDTKFLLKKKRKEVNPKTKRPITLISKEDHHKPTTKQLKSEGPEKQARNKNKPSQLYVPEKDKSPKVLKSNDLTKSTNSKNSHKASQLPTSRNDQQKGNTLTEKSVTQAFLNIKSNPNPDGSRFLLRESRLDKVVQRLERKDPSLMTTAVVESSRLGMGGLTSPTFVQNQIALLMMGTMASKGMLSDAASSQGKTRDSMDLKDFPTKAFGGFLMPQISGITETKGKKSCDESSVLHGQEHPEGVDIIQAKETIGNQVFPTANENSNKKDEPFAASSLFSSENTLSFQELGRFKFPEDENLFTSTSFGKYRNRRDSDRDE